MKSVTFAAVVIALGTALSVLTVTAKEQSVAGTWTFKVEQIGLQLVLEQKDATVTGTLDWPHGDPIKLTGQLARDTLTFSGDSGGENFTVHIDSSGLLKDDGTLAGTLRAHFVDFNDAHEVVRSMDQDIPWTATRGLHDVVHFGK